LDNTNSILHQSDQIDESTKSEVNCNSFSCEITNACITSSSGIALFGPSNHVKREKAKLIGMKKQKFAGDNPHNDIYRITSKGEGNYKLKKGVATMGLGLQNYPCDAHMKHVVWPLIRINLLHRDQEDVVNNGIGDLFLHSVDNFSCGSMYTPLSDKINLFRFIPEGSTKCYSRILVGTSLSYTTKFHEYLRSMRSLYYNYYNISEMTKRDTIVITKSKELNNLDKIVSVMKKEYPQYRTSVVQWEDYTLKDQLKTLARTKILIGLPVNGLKYIAMFIQDNTGVIYVCNEGESSIKLQRNWYISSVLKGRNPMTELCNKNEVTFFDMKANVDVGALKRSVGGLIGL